MPTLNGVLVQRIDLKLSPKVALNCDNRRCLCTAQNAFCCLVGAILNILCPRERWVFQSKLGVSISNQRNLHHSPHTGHLEKKIKKRVQSFSDTVYNSPGVYEEWSTFEHESGLSLGTSEITRPVKKHRIPDDLNLK